MSIRRPVVLGLAALLAGSLLTASPPSASAGTSAVPGASIYIANAGTGAAGVFTGSGQHLTDVGVEYSAGDGFALGDVNFDGVDEFVLADHETDQIVIRDAHGTRINSFPADYDTNSRLAVGDVDGDSHDDIVVRHHSLLVVESVDAYNQLGTKIVGIGQFFGANGFLATGDINANGTEEIWVHQTVTGQMSIFNGSTGALVQEFGFHGQPGQSGFAVGDVNGDGRAEYALGDPGGSGLLNVFNPTNGSTWFIGWVFHPGGQLAMGDVDGDGADEVVVMNPPAFGITPDVEVYRASGALVTTLAVPRTIDDTVAVGQFGDGDIDGDSIPDRVELNGIRRPDGTMSMDLAALGASPCRKTIVVELDYMAGAGGHSHRPNDAVAGAIDEARAAFATAPLPAVTNCPYPGVDTADGIKLIVDVDDPFPEQQVFHTPDDFEAIKGNPFYFDPARDPFVHYNLWVHHHDKGDGESDSSGLANFSRDDQDFLVSLASFGGGNGTTREQSGTFMHELGHTLGLRHGGGDETNHKPNYLSVMNYQFQMSGISNPAGTASAIDYSDRELARLDSKHLNEKIGIGGVALQTEWYDRTGTHQSGPATAKIDWSGHNADGLGNSDDDPDVPVAINGGRCVGEGDDGTLTTGAAGDDVVQGTKIRSGDNFVCDTHAGAGDEQEAPVGTDHRYLTGFDDWHNLNLRRGTGPGAEPEDEITAAEAEELAQEHDQATTPDMSVLLNASRPGFYSPVLGVAMDDRFVYATHYYHTIAEPHTSDQPGSLVVLDKATMQVKTRIPVGYAPRSVALDPLRRRAYVLNHPTPAEPTITEITVVDTTALTVVGTVRMATAQALADIAVNPQTNRVYVPNGSQGFVHVINGASLTELPKVQIGLGGQGVAVDQTTNTVYVAMSYRVAQPFVTALGSFTDNGVTTQVHPLVDLGEPLTQPMDVTVDATNDRIYVAGLGGGGVSPSVTILQRSTRTVLKRVDVGKPARAIAVNPYAQQAFVVGESRVSVVGQQTMAVVRTMPADLPFSVATANGPSRTLYIGDLRSGQLTRLSYSSGQRIPD